MMWYWVAKEMINKSDGKSRSLEKTYVMKDVSMKGENINDKYVVVLGIVGASAVEEPNLEFSSRKPGCD